ncbi:hypothetical protein FKM82_021165 [Ascaphus truei]
MIDSARAMSALSHSIDIFVSERRSGWKNIICLSLLCLGLGLATGVSLFLVLQLSTVCSSEASLAIACLLGILLSLILFFFKCVRCMSLLFLLSCGMREGRNALITAGTGIIVFYNVKNIFGNFKGLADSITCNVEAKRFSLRIIPFDFYRQAMYWIYNQNKFFLNPYKDIISVSDTFLVDVLISDDSLKTMLNETKQHIQIVSDNISSLLDIASYVGQMILLVVGVLIVLVGTGLFLRKFLDTDSKKFENLYITKRFMEYDNSRRQQQVACVFPLNKNEKRDYIRIPSLQITGKEKKKMVLFFIPVFANISIWSLVTIIDFVLHLLICAVSKHLQELPPIVVPINVSINIRIYCF